MNLNLRLSAAKTLLRGRADVDVDFLVAAEPAAAKYEQRAHYKNHKNYENCHDSGACSAAAIVCHLFFLLTGR